MTRIALTILGQPYSKANSRQIVTIGDRPSSIKSKKAREYEFHALRQIPPAARLRIEGPVKVTATIYYATERPDLDESLILDILQDRTKLVAQPGTEEKVRMLVQAGVYRNDRQVRWKDIRHAIDKRNPRTEIVVESLQPQQVELVTSEFKLAPTTKRDELQLELGAAKQRTLETPF